MTLKLFTLFLFSAVKFAIAFPIAIEYQLNFLQAFSITAGGGIFGVLFFAYLTEPLVKIWNAMVGFVRPSEVQEVRQPIVHHKKKVFTPQKRRLIKIKVNYGLIGIALTTPILLSIPLGTFFAVRFYSRKTSTLMYLIVSIVLWSLLLSYFAASLNFKLSDIIKLIVN